MADAEETSDAAPPLPASADSAAVDPATTKAASPEAGGKDIETDSAAAAAAAADSGVAATATATAAAAANAGDSGKKNPPAAEPDEPEEEPLNVLYCDVCSVPPEYCAYMDSFDDCMRWLYKYHAETATRLEVAGESEHAALKPSRRKTKRGGAKQKKAAMNAVQEVHISKIKRKARKYVTTVFGLDTFGHSLKPSAKIFGKHFACGAAVQKQVSGGKAIVIQGDFQMEVPAMLRKKFKIPPKKMYFMEKTTKSPIPRHFF